MQEDGASLRGYARPLIQHGRTLLAHLRQRRVDIVHFQANMVQALTALLKKACQARIGGRRFDQFDLATAWAAERQEGDTHLLRRHLFHLARLNSQRIAIEGQRLLKAAHNNSDMIDTFWQRHLQAPSLSVLSGTPGTRKRTTNSDSNEIRWSAGAVGWLKRGPCPAAPSWLNRARPLTR